MKDLLGHDTQDTPPMTAPLPYVVYAITSPASENPEYWGARSVQEACEAFTDCMGIEATSCVESDNKAANDRLATTLTTCIVNCAVYLLGDE